MGPAVLNRRCFGEGRAQYFNAPRPGARPQRAPPLVLPGGLGRSFIRRRCSG
jgi:hypothetical protein